METALTFIVHVFNNENDFHFVTMCVVTDAELQVDRFNHLSIKVVDVDDLSGLGVEAEGAVVGVVDVVRVIVRIAAYNLVGEHVALVVVDRLQGE